MEGLDINTMFAAALNLDQKWHVASVVFDHEAGRLDVGLDFSRGTRFSCPEPDCDQTQCAVMAQKAS